MRVRQAGLLSAILLTFAAGPAFADAPIEDSVVRIFATMRLPNPMRPWAKQNPVETMGTGIVIEGKKILTNAHVVMYATEIKVQGRQGGDRIDAKVATIGMGIDLATLELEDEDFFKSRPPMPRAAGRPTANAAVAVMGFAAGGSNLSVTRGIVSRVDYASFGDLIDGLRIQVDAAATSGNSGGPALVADKMIGLVFSRPSAAAGGGYVIPNEEIDLYLDDVKDGRYDGKYRLDGSRFQTLENEALRAKLGLAKSVHGIMFRQLHGNAQASPLRPDDVLTRVGAAEIDNEGLVDYSPELRLPFTSLIHKSAKGAAVPVALIREGKAMQIDLPLTRENNRLIKAYTGAYPSYFVHGPFVFSPVMAGTLEFYARGNPLSTLNSPMFTRENDLEAFPGEELVVVTSPLMAHKITRGYGDPFGLVVHDVDGVGVKSLRHLVEVVRAGTSEFLTIRFFGDVSETMVFRRKALEEATAEIMTDNGVPRRCSPDLAAAWEGKAAP